MLTSDEFTKDASPVSKEVIDQAGRIASFATDTVLASTKYACCLFSVYLENTEIASATSSRSAEDSEGMLKACNMVDHSSNDEWVLNGIRVRRIFRQATRRISYVLFLCSKEGESCELIGITNILEIFDSAVRLLDGLASQLSVMQILARSSALKPADASAPVATVLTGAGDAVSDIFQTQSFAVLLVNENRLWSAGGRGNALEIAHELISSGNCAQEIRSLIFHGQPHFFHEDADNEFKSLSAKMRGMSANAVQLPGGVTALYLIDIRGSPATDMRHVESYIQSSLLAALSKGIEVMDRNLKHSRANSLWQMLQSINQSADFQTLEMLSFSTANQLFGGTDRCCILEVRRTCGGSSLKKCMCRNKLNELDTGSMPNDRDLERAARELLPVVSYSPPDGIAGDDAYSHHDGRTVEKMQCFIPFSTDIESVTVLFIEKHVLRRFDTDLQYTHMARKTGLSKSHVMIASVLDSAVSIMRTERGFEPLL